MNEAKCVVCGVVLDNDTSGAVVHVTTVTRVEPQADAEDQLVTFDRHYRNLTLCIECWKKAESVMYNS